MTLKGPTPDIINPSKMKTNPDKQHFCLKIELNHYSGVQNPEPLQNEAIHDKNKFLNPVEKGLDNVYYL